MTDLPAKSADLATKDEAGLVRPATAQGLIYKAFRRPYGDGPGQVLVLLASGYYGDAPWELFFVPDSQTPGAFVLMEKVPTIVYFILSYYAASLSAQVGSGDLGSTVTIKDGFGTHQVPIEPF